MYGPILSVLLMGMVPVWGLEETEHLLPSAFSIAPPALEVTRPLPVLTIDGSMSASGILITDLESGQTLYQRSSTVQRPMASLTKLMTALLILENHKLDEWVTVPADIGSIKGSSAHLPAGEQFTVGDLLTALLVPSGNDAAVTLARYHSGSVKAFVEEMNNRARELGMKNTVYVNPTGLDAGDQVSTPRDIAWLTQYVRNHEEIASRMGMRTAQFRSKDGKQVNVMHTHQLLQKDSAVVAGKTGTTDGAGQCLLSIVKHGSRTYLVVLMQSNDRYGDMKPILKTLTQD
jgi:serine-type D-Ala-D-Ala carboxypeptidase (penicillin-binding protein 5/6)